jgi:hypothetical protein
MSATEQVLDGLGPAFRAAAGPVLDDLVAGLATELDVATTLVATTGGGWATVFDLDATPQPAWLGAATGTTVPGGLTVEDQRAYVRDRPAWRRGTVDAMAAAVRALLTGDKHVWFDERVDGNAWHLTVRVYAPDATGLTEDQILAAATTQKPVGLVLDGVTIEPAFTYADLAALYDDYAAVAGDWGDFPFTPEADIPGARWWRPAARTMRYARVLADVATYDDLLDAYPTYRDLRDHDPEES